MTLHFSLSILKKNTLRACVSLMLAGLTFSAHAFASEETVQTVEELMSQKLLTEAGLNRSALAGADLWTRYQGENTYLSMREEIIHAPFNDAIRTLSSDMAFPHAVTGRNVFLTQDEWKLIYMGSGGSTLEKKLGITNSLVLPDTIQRIRKTVEEEVENNRFKRELNSSVLSTEIFSDGNINNSGGFDLLTDLQIVEIILLGDVSAGAYDHAREQAGLPPLPSVNGAPPTPPATDGSANGAGTSEGGASGATTTTSRTERGETALALKTKASAGQGFADDKKEFPTSPTISPPLYNPFGLNPSACEGDPEISNAFDDFIATLDLENKKSFTPSVPRDSITPKTTTISAGKPAGRGETDDDSSGDSEGSSSSSLEPPVARDTFDDVPKAEKHEWQNEEFCSKNKRFCIEVKFIKNGQECQFGEDADNPCASITFGIGGGDSESGGYETSENCVACHMKFMLENLDLLLSKTLTPSKVPGNLLESGKCKKSLFKVTPSLNLFAIKKPISFPVDDIIFQSSNPFESFKNELTFNSAKKTDSPENIRTDRNTRHIVSFGEGKTVSAIFAEIDKADTTFEEELRFERELALLEQELAAQVNGYEDISGKMEEINSLIGSLDEIASQTGTQVCESLQSKKTCE